MHRTQIYLSEAEMVFLKTLSTRSKKALSELIRQAIDQFYAIGKKKNFAQAVDQAYGIWANRTDLPSTQSYLRALRTSKRLEAAGR